MLVENPGHAPPPSRLVLSDRLLNLAEDAERAGCGVAAEHLLALAHAVFDEAAPWRLPPTRRQRRDG